MAETLWKSAYGGKAALEAAGGEGNEDDCAWLYIDTECTFLLPEDIRSLRKALDKLEAAYNTER